MGMWACLEEPLLFCLSQSKYIPSGKCLDRGEMEKGQHGSPEKERLGCVALTFTSLFHSHPSSCSRGLK